MKKIIFLVSFCLAGMCSYSQVTTDPKKQPEIKAENKKVNTPRLTPLCYGKIAADGTILSGTKNFTVQKSGEADNGIYWIRCDGISEFSVIIATAQHYEYQCTGNVDPQSYFPNRMTFQTHKLSTSKLSAAAFQFVIYDP